MIEIYQNKKVNKDIDLFLCGLCSSVMQVRSGLLTFAVVFIPRIDTVLDAVTHQGVVDTHVAVTEECVRITWSCEEHRNYI